MTTSYPIYYDLAHGIPVRKLRESALPEKMRPDGAWEAIADPLRMGTEAHRVDKAEFDRLVAAEREAGHVAPTGRTCRLRARAG